ncbi:hypothetical protein NFI96_011745, partial [Prochilodus magdalenae]
MKKKDTKCSTCESADGTRTFSLEMERNCRRAASRETHVGTLASTFQKNSSFVIVNKLLGMGKT